MPKKSSLKSPAAVPENPPEKKPTSTPKKPVNEIDEIFSAKKRKRADEQMKKVAEDAAVKKSKTKKEKKMKKDKVFSEREFADPQSRPRKKTGDGLVIYTEDELGIGKADAGGTRLCPFDCECCF